MRVSRVASKRPSSRHNAQYLTTGAATGWPWPAPAAPSSTPPRSSTTEHRHYRADPATASRPRLRPGPFARVRRTWAARRRARLHELPGSAGQAPGRSRRHTTHSPPKITCCCQWQQAGNLAAPRRPGRRHDAPTMCHPAAATDSARSGNLGRELEQRLAACQCVWFRSAGCRARGCAWCQPPSFMRRCGRPELIFAGCALAAACAGRVPLADLRNVGCSRACGRGLRASGQQNAARSLVKPVTIWVAHRQVWSIRRCRRRALRVSWAATCSTR